MILLTGGAGFIGSHTALELMASGHQLVLVDNLSNAQLSVIERLEQLSGKIVPFHEGDVGDLAFLESVFQQHDITDVIHFAGSKSVSESIEHPLEYYDNNVGATESLLKIMELHDVRSLVFSSSATVYGPLETMPLKESMTRLPASNPYGLTKQSVEDLLESLAEQDGRWAITSLRYFNPIGAHPSGVIGENPGDKPNNVMPLLMAAAAGDIERLTVFGGDYETPDGTGVRDFIHVVDLAKGHIKALEHNRSNAGHHVFNLGTGKGASVRELITTFEAVTGETVPYQMGPRREGDVAESYADVTKAKEKLSWEAEYNLEAMCRHAWRFYSQQQ